MTRTETSDETSADAVSRGGWARSKHLSLRSRMVLYFGSLLVVGLLLVGLIITYGVPLTDYDGERGSLRESAFGHLNLVADLKKEELLSWMAERRSDMRVLAQSEHIALHVEEIRGPIARQAASGLSGARLWNRVQSERSLVELTRFLDLIMDSYGVYAEIFVVDVPSRVVVATTAMENLGIVAGDEEYLDVALAPGSILVSDVDKNSRTGKLQFHISAAIAGAAPTGEEDTAVTALLVAHIDPEAIFGPILHTGKGLARTGEALLVNWDTRILTSLKHPLADGSIATQLEYQIEARPAILASRGEEGMSTAADYRGQPVFAAYRHLRLSAEFGWGLVVKQDQEEIFAHARQELSYMAIAGVVGILLLLGVAIIVANRLSRPITALSATARRVEAGDLGARAPAGEPGEIGLLSRSFNAMIRKVQEWQRELETQVAARTAELRQANRRLELEVEERQRAEERAASEQQRLAVTLQTIGDGVITTDRFGDVTLLNDVAQELTGWEQHEAVGKTLPEVFRIINEKTRRAPENPVERVIRSGQVIGLANHTILIAKSGHERFISDSGAPIRDRAGEVIGVVLVFRDVTESRRMEAVHARAQRLETAGRIAGQVAHDFNNMLAPIIAYPDLIQDDLPDGHAAVPLLLNIKRAAERMAEINQQLLALGRRGHYNQSPLNLNEVVEQAVDQIHPLPESLSVRMDLDRKLMNIKGGAAQISRVIANLLTNALDAMEGVGHLLIRTENCYVDETTGKFGVIPRGEYVKLTVSDSGCGVPADLLPKIFDPFFTSKAADRERGSGLGLSIVHAVVEDHGGHIDLESDPGQGTSFLLFFPITRETIETPLSGEIVGGAESVLIVDDDAMQREVTLHLLQNLGYEPTAVDSGVEALGFIERQPVDLVILDMIMPPGIDGAETYRRMLLINPTQKAIVLSGYAESDRVREALSLGAGVFLRKPITLASLAQAVRQELDRTPVTEA